MISLSDGAPAPAHPDSIVQAGHARFTVLTSRLLRLEYSPTGEFTDRPTQVVVDRSFPLPEFTVQRDGAAVVIETSHLRLRYDGGPFRPHGLSVTLVRGATDPHYSAWRFGVELDQNLPLRGNLGGTARTLDGVDGACPLEPGILATYGFAVLDDSASALLTEDGWVAPRPISGPDQQDLYLFAYGRDFPAALADYHALTGPVPLVPRFALGNWWSRYWPYADADYLTLMDRFAAERLPFAVAVIDMDWHLTDIDPDLGTGWTGYTWNPDLFPDPPAFLAALHDRGLAVTLNVHPADGVRRHEAAHAEMCRALGRDPDDGRAIEFDVTDRAFVDAYLAALHHPLEDQGVDFWWLDWQSGATSRVPGLDPLWMLNHIHYLDSGRGGRRPLTFSRYAGPGSHRYPVGFSGDTIVTWASLDFQPRFTATAANIGYPWWSHDVGGHMQGVRDAEMATRWFQLGVFSPVNRLHSSNSLFASKEPASYGEPAATVMGRFLRLRHRLVPALYTAAWAAHTDGRAIVRPMYHEYPTTPAAYTVPNQSLVGEHLVVAPITAPEHATAHVAAVAAWLPAGTWVDVMTGGVYHAGPVGRRLTFHRPLGQAPVLARAGAVIPLAADPLADVGANPGAFEWRVIPGDAVSHLAEDDAPGVPSLADRRLATITQSLTADPDGAATLTLTLAPPSGPPFGTRRLVVDIAGAHSAREVLRDGVPVDVPPTLVEDEVLAPALRIDLGDVDLDAGLCLRLSGLRIVGCDAERDAFALLQAAEIAFELKEAAWSAIRELDGLDLAAALDTEALGTAALGTGALEAGSLPGPLRGALLEVAASAVS